MDVVSKPPWLIRNILGLKTTSRVECFMLYKPSGGKEEMILPSVLLQSINNFWKGYSTKGMESSEIGKKKLT